MRAFTRLLKANATNGAIYVLSASLVAVAVSNYLRPAPVSAQAGTAARKSVMSGEARTVIKSLEDAFVSLAEEVEPSVVTITARSSRQPERTRPQVRPMQQPFGGMDLPEPFKDFFRRLPQGEGDEEGLMPRGASTGSGVIIREAGNTAFILTNNHVVEGRERLRVMLYDKSEYNAELVGHDVRTDLAVLKVKVSHPLPASSVARLGNSDRVKVGQWAVAIGSPLGYDSTLTVGVISAKGRSLNSLGRTTADYSDLIQTDASINPGNSGGALVNIDGEVIGINVAIASNGMSQGNIGIGFAIPINTAKMVAEQLMSKGRVVRGYLGVACSEANRMLSRELKDYLKVPEGGALAESVSPETPAARAGLKDGDVIVRFGDRQIRSFVELNQAVAATAPGTTVPLEVVRDGKPVRLSLTVAERPSEEELAKRLSQGDGPAPRETQGPQAEKTRLGFTVRPGKEGVEVVSVSFDSPAFEAGLRQGDVILEAAGQKVADPASLNRALDNAKDATGIVLRVKTGGGLRLVVVRP